MASLTMALGIILLIYYMFKKGRKVIVSDGFDAAMANLDNVVHWRAAAFASVFKGQCSRPRLLAQ